MKKLLIIITVLSLCIPVTAYQEKFEGLWYDGNAEISTYSLKESRYGEIRNGTRVMVFVTEPMRISTHIKPDAPLPDDQMVKVIKLNDLRTFNTGIYDYRVMTSIFSTVENKQSYDNMTAMKVSFSSQEWCGVVFERYLRLPDSYEGVRYSYFEKEGESDFTYPAANVESEDNLWIRIRELNEPYLNATDSIVIQLIPSRWIIRKSHGTADILQAVITKSAPKRHKTVLGNIPVHKFTWTVNGNSTIVYVEREYPRRIVEFKERDGSSGKLMVSRREPYWKQNDNKHLNLRKKLKLHL